MSNTGVRRKDLFWLTLGCGISVSALYYLQPLLKVIAKDLGASASAISAAAMMTQVGYVLSMLTIAPLGDFKERRTLIVSSCILSGVALILTGTVNSSLLLGLACFGVGFATAAPQLIVPFAASIALPEKRGKVVGTVMSGLMVGILGGRVVSGVIGAQVGWRTTLLCAGLVSILLGLVLNQQLPKSEPKDSFPGYRDLFLSIRNIAFDEWRLRYSCWFGAVSFAAFSAFWTTLAFHLQERPLNFGADIAGLFGLIGIVGAVAAPLSGRLADRKLEHAGNLGSLSLLGLSFAFMLWQGWTLVGMVIGVVVLDFAASFNHISNQSRNYSLRPNATSRVNTVYMTTYFLGGAIGSGLGGWAWQNYQWTGVCLLGISLSLAGVLPAIPYWFMRPESPRTEPSV